MAWFAVMGANSVEYHKETVLGRGDDHPGRALAYYGSRGETPLRWGGTLAEHLGLSGEVTPEAYEAIFGPGGIRHPHTGEQLTRTKVPGFELVIGPHKSVAVLGVMGRADDMHAILDVETTVTMRHLEDLVMERGGRRGRAEVRTPTAGLLYAVTRHGTSREGDPHPHDHILIPNGTVMLDAKGGWKALQSATIRDMVEAATMVGRLHGAAEAIERGYVIEIDQGDSGRARRWRIVGVADEVCDLFSKRADEIAEYLEDQGYTSYRARNIAARATRKIKRHTGVDELMPKWRAELEAIGWPLERLAQVLDEARDQATGLRPRWTEQEVDAVTAELMDPEGEFMRRRKVFTRSRLVAEIAPRLYGHDPAELDPVVDRVIASNLVVSLISAEAAIEQHYGSALVLANEQTIADTIERLIDQPGPQLHPDTIERALDAKAAEVGGALTAGQQAAVEAICSSARAVEVIVGIAGSGKTTALHAAATALEDAGYQVLGTATSGQAARTLGREAHIQARTMRSLLWRLDHHQVTLDDQMVVILDEVGMTADADLARLLLAVERTGAKVVLVGDDRQLSAVGPGGALAAMLARHPGTVTELTENLRQRDPDERRALDQLRHGDLDRAIDFYAARDRIRLGPGRVEALGHMVEQWAADVDAGHDTIMLAFRRANVAALNRIARAHARHHGWLTVPDLQAPGGRLYAAGDPVVLLAPNRDGDLVTSQRGTVAAIHPERQALTLLTDDGRTVTLTGEAIDAEHLDHGYAITVHREQGGTCDRTHYFADGGGRELAYVALSRARDRTVIHAVADDLEQAIEHITYDWSQEQHQQWVTDTHERGQDPRADPLPVATRAERIAQLRREIEHLKRQRPPDVTHELAATARHLRHLEDDRTDFEHGTGRWQHTPEGEAARDLRQAGWQLRVARARLDTAHGLRARHRANRQLHNAQNLHAHARQHWEAIAEPAAHRLNADIQTTRRRFAELRRDHRFNQLWHRDHPEITKAIADRTKQLHQLETQPASASAARGQDEHDRARHAERSPVFGDLDAALTHLAAVAETLEQQPPGPPGTVDPPTPYIDPPAPDVGLGL